MDKLESSSEQRLPEGWEWVPCGSRWVTASPHCVARYRQRVLAVSEAGARARLRDLIVGARVMRERPGWVNGTPQPFYVVAHGGRVVLPAKPIFPGRGDLLLAVTCLSKATSEADGLVRRMREAGIVR